MEITLKQTAELLKEAKSIIIASHINPDGDAIGSSLGMMHALSKAGKEVSVYIDDKLPRVFGILPGIETIKRPPETLTKKFTPDYLLILDTSKERIGAVASMVDAPILNIDHHVTNPKDADFLCLDADAAATAEIVTKLLTEMGVPIDEDAATCLYTGLATDTGFFRYASTTAATMRQAATLLEKGVKPHLISEAMEMKPFAVLKGLADAIDTVEIYEEGKLAGMFIPCELAEKLETTEGFVDAIRVIEGVDVALFMREPELGRCRVSMRSKKLDVAKVAASLGGGGHIRASGVTLNMPFGDAKKTILAALHDAFASTQ